MSTPCPRFHRKLVVLQMFTISFHVISVASILACMAVIGSAILLSLSLSIKTDKVLCKCESLKGNQKLDKAIKHLQASLRNEQRQQCLNDFSGKAILLSFSSHQAEPLTNQIMFTDIKQVDNTGKVESALEFFFFGCCLGAYLFAWICK